MSNENTQEILKAHGIVWESNGDYGETAWVECDCSNTEGDDGWTGDNESDHRVHLAEVLDKHMQEREVALLSEVAEEAIEKYADKPYSPGHVIRLLLSRANELRKAATNGR